MSTPHAPQPQYEDQIDLARYLGFFTRHWLILLGGLLGGAVIAVVISSSLIPPRFQATATLMVAPPSGATPLALTPSTAKTLLVDPAMVWATVNQLGLNREGLTTQRFIDESLDVDPVPGTNVVKLSVVLSDPTKARLAATLLARKVIELNERIARDASSVSRNALERQLMEADRNLRDAEQRLLTFQSSANLDAVQAETSSKTSLRTEANSVGIALESERARLATLEQELARQPTKLDAALPRGAATDLRSRQNQGAAVETDPLANPVYTMLQYDIAQSRATISRLERQERQTLAMTSGAAIASRRAELYRDRLQLARLQAEYDVRFRIYNAVLSQSEDAGRSAAGTPQLQLVTAPAQPDQPMPRKRRQFASLGGIIGLVCGIVAALVIDRRRAQA